MPVDLSIDGGQDRAGQAPQVRRYQIDATIIRGVLAPALVALLGRANWWLPSPAARLLRIIPLAAGKAHGSPAAPGGVRPASRR